AAGASADAARGAVCVPACCQNVAPAGLAGAECLLSAAVAEPVCPAGTIDPKLTQFANKKLQRALDNVRKAAQATKAKQQQKLIDKAGGLLGKILRRELGTTS